MNSPTENILQDLFQTTSLQNVSVEKLQQEIDEHPYNGAAYFLLAKKFFLSKDAAYKDVLQKAALHFSNDLWFNFNLTSDERNTAENLAIQTHTTEEIVATDETAEQITDSETEDFVEEKILADFAVNEKLSAMLQQQAAAFEKPVEVSAEIPVENMPYHRVDYFDSQGIKLEEDKANDKLGTQLKRFTDWLKQMKRISPNPAELDNDEAGETKVKNIAEHSNEPEEIVTEAMADVLIKQGKPQQAIEIYQKLSFNNPSKTAYFAAKIEELKGKQWH